MTPESVSTPVQSDAVARSALYSHLASWLRFPWEDFHSAALAGELEPTLRECLEGLPYSIEGAEAELERIREVEPDYDEFQSVYVGLFDVGAGGPPCPLYGGVWAGDRQKTMEESLRFYRFFGLTISDDDRELPDHLCTQLEFLHFLTFREAEALTDSADTEPLRRAARDFLIRHPVRWLPRLLDKLATTDAPPFWCGLIGLASVYCTADAGYLIATEGVVQD